MIWRRGCPPQHLQAHVLISLCNFAVSLHIFPLLCQLVFVLSLSIDCGLGHRHLLQDSQLLLGLSQCAKMISINRLWLGGSLDGSSRCMIQAPNALAQESRNGSSSVTVPSFTDAVYPVGIESPVIGMIETTS